MALFERSPDVWIKRPGDRFGVDANGWMKMAGDLNEAGFDEPTGNPNAFNVDRIAQVYACNQRQ